MSGRPKIKVYLYNGKGAYLRSYNSVSDFRFDYFPDDKGKRPILIYKELGIEYYYNKDLDIILMTVRPGREKIKLIVAIHNSDLCKKQDDDDQIPVQILNLRGEMIAEFKSQRLLTKLVPLVTTMGLSRSLNSKVIRKKKNIVKSEVHCQYKK